VHVTVRVRGLFVACFGVALLAGSSTAAARTQQATEPCHSLTRRVEAGDTLFALARRYKVTVAALARANGLDPDGVLPIGFMLRIPRQSCAAAAVRLAKALRIAAASPMTTGAAVVDLETGETVYALNEDTPLAPASTEKLPLATAALRLLGAGFRTETLVLAVGTRSGGVWQGDLYLKGFGDPLLGGPALLRLARQVRASGIRAATGAIVGDESFFDRLRTGPGWKAEFYKHESPPLSALVADRAVLDGRLVGRPALAAAILFRRALAVAGVRVPGSAREGAAPSAALQIARVASPPLIRILAEMDTWSDNFAAEMLLKLLGAHELGSGSSSAGARVVRRALATDGIELDGRLADGSGLSSLDRLTVADLSSLVAYICRTPSLRPLLGTLAVAGVSGTLRHRLRDVPGHGLVRGKTGSTDEASALVGVVADRYAFAIVQNGAPVDFTAAHAAQDRFVRVLLGAR
jgi:D-alanyl-D-alanine carboxypeptidase/D-alanyl-D-alanine-endopeptidase (penicillin-binding protein 4)